jgi:hypothetical protein
VDVNIVLDEHELIRRSVFGSYIVGVIDICKRNCYLFERLQNVIFVTYSVVEVLFTTMIS